MVISLLRMKRSYVARLCVHIAAVSFVSVGGSADDAAEVGGGCTCICMVLFTAWFHPAALLQLPEKEISVHLAGTFHVHTGDQNLP